MTGNTETEFTRSIDHERIGQDFSIRLDEKSASLTLNASAFLVQVACANQLRDADMFAGHYL